MPADLPAHVPTASAQLAGTEPGAAPGREPSGDLRGAAAEALAAHPWIAAAEPEPGGGLRLVPDRAALAVRPEPGGLVAEFLDHWSEVYDWTYTDAAARHSPDLDLSGWRASDTGRPLPAGHMREWADRTAELILGARPRYVLELGCGTGLLAHRLRDRVHGYVGTDVAPAAVRALDADARPGTAFVRAAAHESGAPQVREALERIGCPDGRPDCIVLNSVTQCFPGVDYLEAVLHGMLALVAPGGTVLVGDVRDARLLDDFARWAERGDGERAAERAAREPELLFDPPTLARLAERAPRDVRMSVHPKTMRDDSELTRYRFDAVLHVDRSPARPAEPAWFPNRALADVPGARWASELREIADGRAVVQDPADPARIGFDAARPVADVSGAGTAHEPFAAFAERRLLEVARTVVRRSVPQARDVPLTVEPFALADRAERAADGAVAGVDAAAVPAFLRRLDEAALRAIADAVRPVRDAGSPDAIADALGVADRHRWILRRWLAVLDRADVPAGDIGTLVEDGRAIGYPPETTRFMLAAMGRLPELLRDDLPLQALLFEDADTADGAYRENTVNRYLNAAVAEVMRWALATVRPDGPLRVLEVGAGVGGTTADALAGLAGRDVDYLYTDVSRYFTSLGRRRFGDRPGVRFGLFDVNADLAAQDVEPASRHVILAANVLHNARHLPRMLAGLRDLLVPGGLLVFVETGREMPALLASMQFLMSPPAGTERLAPEDPRAGTDRVFLTPAEWTNELHRAGLHPLLTLPHPNHPLQEAGVHLFTARRE
ncbi:methyltransferase [Actinomadura algeriensis]|uniref:SAM-dependent methyltransferase n=1 Tax=Actinomadura algeriensis TaxID=1679523 RepID=A0ABR9JRA7_9ACTN|nr:methyltransferase [Actinomadura algeriensis]MBE1533057.1 SAM-dependent methyltransferase [Actinomadura algeriensis]